MKSASKIRVGLLAYGAIGEGSTVELSLMGGAVMVNKANVVTADIMADNGVVHVIDAVILPKDVKVASLLKK